MSASRSAFVLVALLACGCVSKGRYTALESQYRSLSEEVAALQSTNKNLEHSHQNAVAKLDQAETELAEMDDRYGAAHRELSEADRARGLLKEQVAALARAPQAANPLNRQLAELSRSHPALRYDPETGVSKLQTDILFDQAGDQVNAQGRKLISQLTSIFMSPAAEDLRIMVVGHTDDQQVGKRPLREKYPSNWHLASARALAVAAALREAGFPEERMGVAAYAGHQPIANNDDEATRQRNRRVEIFLIGPATPIVGWSETIPSVYR